VRLGLTSLKGGFYLVFGRNHARAAPTPSGHGLDDHQAASQRGKERPRLVQGDRVVQPREYRHIGRPRSVAGTGLVAEQVEMRDIGADEDQPGVGTGLSEVDTLGQEAVAGVDGVAARRVGRRNDCFRIHIGGGALTRQRLNLVGDTGVQGSSVIHGTNSDGRQSHVGGRAGDADRDFAAIGDQQSCHTHDWSFRGSIRVKPALCR
jgi:hypothetical protein